MATIHIKFTTDTEDKIISEFMNVLIKYEFKAEKYLGINSKIIMAKREEISEAYQHILNGKIQSALKEIKANAGNVIANREEVKWIKHF